MGSAPVGGATIVFGGRSFVVSRRPGAPGGIPVPAGKAIGGQCRARAKGRQGNGRKGDERGEQADAAGRKHGVILLPHGWSNLRGATIKSQSRIVSRS